MKLNFCFSSTGGSQNPMQMTIDPAQKSSQPSSAPEIPYQFADPCPVKIFKRWDFFQKKTYFFYKFRFQCEKSISPI